MASFTTRPHPGFSRRLPLLPATLLVVLALFFSSAYSLSFVRVADEHLHEKAEVIVVGTVQRAVPRWEIHHHHQGMERNSPTPTPGPSKRLTTTDYFFEVEEVLKGDIIKTEGKNHTIQVCVNGGRWGDDEEMLSNDTAVLVVPGAPRFELGEKVLLFLNQKSESDDEYLVVDVALGAFHEVIHENGNTEYNTRTPKSRSIAFRGLDSTGDERTSFLEFSRRGEVVAPNPDEVQARDFSKFIDWLRDKSQGREREPDYFVSMTAEEASQTAQQKAARYNTHKITYGDKVVQVRWFTFDSGSGVVNWRGYPRSGQPGSGISSGGASEMQNSMNSWNSYVNVNYKYLGATASALGNGLSKGPDGANTIVFQDLVSQINGGNSFDPARGGALAICGFWYSGIRQWKGKTYGNIIEGDMVVERNVEAWFSARSQPARALESLFTHELGHSLGINHSCGDSRSGTCAAGSAADQAIMRANVQTRGTSLGSDDKAGIAQLYDVRGATPPPAAPVCGDRIVNQASEQCDDGNLINGDGCDKNCKREVCGNNIVQTGEQCDDGNKANGDGCDSNCKKEVCGNNIVQTGEQCDDGNKVNGDGCDSNCKSEVCGNRIVQTGEQCDDGNKVNGDGCDKNCKSEVCGNKVVQTGEQCDDGNRVNGDGCDSNCKSEKCGNNILQTGEQCDDGNNVNGDGCSSTCQIEKAVPPPTPSTPSPSDIPISATLTIRVPKAPESVSILAFVQELASVLNIPTAAIEQVQIILDASTIQPPSTVIFFVLTTAGGIDPVAKGQELKALAQSNSPKLAATETLGGMQVLNMEAKTEEAKEGNNNAKGNLTMIIAVTVGGSVGLLLIVSGVILLVVLRRRKIRTHQTSSEKDGLEAPLERVSSPQMSPSLVHPASVPAPTTPQFTVGTICKAQFSGDGQFYSAVIDQVENESLYLVRYFEFGDDGEWVPLSSLRPASEVPS